MILYNLPKGNILAISAGEWGGSLSYRPNDTTLKYFSINGKQDTVNNKYANIRHFVSGLPKIQQMFKGKRLLIQYGNFTRIFSYRGGTYVVEDREGYSYYGVFYRLFILKDGFYMKKVLDLNEDALVKESFLKKIPDKFEYWNTPVGMMVYKNSIFLTTTQRFYIIKNWHKALVLTNLFWGYLNPNSFALLRHSLFVGMRGGYAKIDLRKKDMIFFKYQKP